MQRLAPYQSGLWLAEYLSIRCQLCRVYRSEPLLKSSLNQAVTAPNSLQANHSITARLQRKLNNRFNSGLLCAHCQNSIVWLPTPFYVDIAVGTTLPIQPASYYDYPIRQVVRAFKHHEDMTKLPLLIHVLRQLPRPLGCHSNNSVILPMPTTPSRLIKRGFDPVTILSTYLSKHWQIPLWHGVQRVDNTVSQQGLTRAERLTNLNDAFILIKQPPVRRILLFDDVATTGASLQALARVLAVPSNNSDAPSSTSPNTGIKSNLYHLSAYALAHGSPNN
ncbi:ComF family protein [Psychrobacter sp. CAL346-MNA-CIBAN-0220]|uniref:ComF family protein n=1 Tax=Psychrobacter sp. CAL346-MNA-CIBAN-0220 TaxID=3140457 RepID=UPI003322B4DB